MDDIWIIHGWYMDDMCDVDGWGKNPLKNMSSSIGMIIPNLVYGKIPFMFQTTNQKRSNLSWTSTMKGTGEVSPHLYHSANLSGPVAAWDWLRLLFAGSNASSAVFSCVGNPSYGLETSPNGKFTSRDWRVTLPSPELLGLDWIYQNHSPCIDDFPVQTSMKM